MDKIVKLIQEKELQFILKMALCWLYIISEIPSRDTHVFRQSKRDIPQEWNS